MKKLVPIILLVVLIFPFTANAALTDSLVSYYKFDESSGNANDSVGLNTLTNNSVSYTAGIINNGISTDSGEYLNRSSAITTNTTNISASFWIYLTSTSEKGAFFRLGNGGGTSGLGIGVGNIQYDGAGGDGNNLILLIDGVAWRSFGSIGGAGWHHIVVTRGTTTWKAYVDGTLLSTTFSDTPGSVTANTDVGRDDGQASPFTGKIDELGVWEKELSSTEVTELYNSGSGLQYPFTTSSSAITGIGTINSIAKFTDTNIIGNSIITDNGSDVTVGGGLISNFLKLVANNLGIDTLTSGLLSIGSTTANAINIGHSGIITSIFGSLNSGTTTVARLNTNNNCASSASPSNCGISPAGSVVMPISGSTIVVNTSAVTANSQILITEDFSLGSRLGITCNTTTGRIYTISSRTAGASFTIKANKNVTGNAACLSYLIVN